MGDRCYLRMRFLESDLEKVSEILGEKLDADEMEEEDGALVYIDEESNYGLGSAREALAKADVIFDGNHEAGDDYPKCEFCGIDGQSLELEGEDNFPWARVGYNLDTGQVDWKAVEEARAFYAARAKVKASFELANKFKAKTEDR